MASSHTKFNTRPVPTAKHRSVQPIAHGGGAHALAKSHAAQAARVPRLAKLHANLSNAKAGGAASSKGRK